MPFPIMTGSNLGYFCNLRPINRQAKGKLEGLVMYSFPPVNKGSAPEYRFIQDEE